METPEEAFANIAFDILDSVALTEIFKKLHPTEVLSLCQTNKHFGKICKNQEIFRILMQVHYSQFPIGNNPKEQYGEITSNRGLIYSVDILDGKTDPIKLDKYAYVNNNAKVLELRSHLTKQDYNSKTINFKILGTKIRTGEKLWLLAIKNKEQNGIYYTGEIFQNREDVLNEIIDIYHFEPDMLHYYFYTLKSEYAATIFPDNLEDIDAFQTKDYAKLAQRNQYKKQLDKNRREYVDELRYDDKEFMLFLNSKGYTTPFSLESIRKYVSDNSYINLEYRKISLGKGKMRTLSVFNISIHEIFLT